MAGKSATKLPQNSERTITLPITQDHDAEIIHDAKRFRAEWLDPFFVDCPELIPVGFEEGYEMNGHDRSQRQGMDIRRIAL